MPPRKKDTEPQAVEPVESGRFYELRDSVAGNRRGPYKLTENLVFPELTRRRLRECMAAPTVDEQVKILLGGDHEEAVEALYADRPIEEWAAFRKDLLAHYFGQGAEQLPGGSAGS